MTTRWGIEHYPSCTGPTEAEQIEIVDLGDNVEALQCIHCGAYRTRDIPTGELPALPPLGPKPEGVYDWAQRHRIIGTGRIHWPAMKRPAGDPIATFFSATVAHEMSREAAEMIRERFRQAFDLPTLREMVEDDPDLFRTDFGDLEARVLGTVAHESMSRQLHDLGMNGYLDEMPDKVESMKPPPDYLQHDPTKNTRKRKRK